MKILAVILMVMCLASCSAVKTKTIATIDQLCKDSEFLAGDFEGYYQGRKNLIFTAQTLDDVKFIRAFCLKPVAERLEFDYGYIKGRAADNAQRAIKPLLGADALTIGSSLGAW